MSQSDDENVYVRLADIPLQEPPHSTFVSSQRKENSVGQKLLPPQDELDTTTGEMVRLNLVGEVLQLVKDKSIDNELAAKFLDSMNVGNTPSSRHSDYATEYFDALSDDEDEDDDDAVNVLVKKPPVDTLVVRRKKKPSPSNVDTCFYYSDVVGYMESECADGHFPSQSGSKKEVSQWLQSNPDIPGNPKPLVKIQHKSRHSVIYHCSTKKCPARIKLAHPKEADGYLYFLSPNEPRFLKHFENCPHAGKELTPLHGFATEEEVGGKDTAGDSMSMLTTDESQTVDFSFLLG